MKYDIAPLAWDDDSFEDSLFLDCHTIVGRYTILSWFKKYKLRIVRDGELWTIHDSIEQAKDWAWEQHLDYLSSVLVEVLPRKR